MKKRGHRRNSRNKFHKSNEDKKTSEFPIKKFFFWFIVYAFLILIFTLLFESTKLYQSKVGFSLVMGYLLVLSSRIVYSAMNKKSLRLNNIIVWGLIYSVIFGLIDFIFSRLPQIKINPNYDQYLILIIFSIIFTIVIMFLRRMKITSHKHRNKSLFSRAPSQIFSGIILIVFGILVFRFSTEIFVGWFNWYEGLAWSWLIGLSLIIGGILTLIAWWRNNVSMFTTRHNVNWKNH